MDRLLFLPIAIALAIISTSFHLSNLAYGFVVGIALVIFNVLLGNKGYFELRLGFWMSVLGAVCLVVSMFLSNRHGLSFEGLLNDVNLPKFVRRLPIFGVSLTTIGIVIILTNFIRKLRADSKIKKL
jgi:heme/copper-type cytochrome/quinol oxidase subunit 1